MTFDLPSGSRLLSEDLAEINNITKAWTTWTPTLANITLGSGSTTIARYRKVGQTLDYHFRVTLGTGGAVGTGPSFTLPFNAHSSYLAFCDIVGDGILRDNTANQYRAAGWLTTAGGNTVQIVHSTTTLVTITATVPFTWTVSDSLICSGTIELA